MSTLGASLSLAAKGCRVFPIDALTKKPSITGWPERSTTDEAAIRKWWSRWPNANVGIHARGLLILDIDGPVGEENLRLLRRHFDQPETVQIISGNTAEPYHYQLIYRLPQGLRAWNKPLAKFKGFERYAKIDLKSTRGQVLGPGSVHKTGGVYRWAVEPSSVPGEATPAPEWMLAAFCTPDATEGQGRHAIGSDGELFQILVNRFPIKGTGQRNGRMAEVVSWLVGKGVDTARVCRLATAWVRNFASVYATPVEDAEREVLPLVHRTVTNLHAGRFTLMTDHQERAAAECLLPQVRQWYDTFLNPRPATQREEESTKRVLCSPARSRFSVAESNFIHCLLLHCQYELRTKGFAEVVPMTDRQLIAIHERVFGRELCWKSYYTLKAKFITRVKDDGTRLAATRKELLALQQRGDYGTASVYRLTGLAQPFEILQGRQGSHGGWHRDAGSSMQASRSRLVSNRCKA